MIAVHAHWLDIVHLGSVVAVAADVHVRALAGLDGTECACVAEDRLGVESIVRGISRHRPRGFGHVSPWRSRYEEFC